jgi:hypothetical protein
VLNGYRCKEVRITAAKLGGTAVYMDFTPPILNNDIIVFSVQKRGNHQNHYKVEVQGKWCGGRQQKRRLAHSVLFNILLFLKYNKGTSNFNVLKCQQRSKNVQKKGL